MQKHRITVHIGRREVHFETGKIAKQANGSVLVREGDTIVLATACASAEAQPVDFLPLRVDYQEKFSSMGKTLGGFIKREGKPSEKEILTSRLIDRPLRPMFEEGYHNDVQLLAYVMSYDGMHMPDPLAICACSAALVLSDIPLLKPVGAVRVGLVGSEFVVNPTTEEMKVSTLDLMLAGTEDAILMIEGYCDFLNEDQLLKAIETGHEAIKTICHALHDWQKQIGKSKNRSTLRITPAEAKEAVKAIATEPLNRAIRIQKKKERELALKAVKEQLLSELFPEGKEPLFEKHDILFSYDELSSHLMRSLILDEQLRADGRKLNEIRPIDVEQSLLPRAHGSSLFTRGETQTIAVCTLGSESMAQRYEELDSEGSRRFYLQYFFPPYSVGEVGRIGPPGRREVGHGKLAERALQAILPKREQFPYTIRLESNITESNGSSSMASVCGGCLSMMDAGVPISRPVAGIAMGLILVGERYAILSDILGLEDALGDMDFKVTGDANGITAFQMDIKVEGITLEIMRVALAEAKIGRTHILNKMLEACPQARLQMSAYAPRIENFYVKPSKIGIIIGPGGKQIRAIVEQTGAEINIEDDGLVSISASTAAALEQAKAIIHGLTAEIEIGKVYKGRVTSVVAFGAFVEVLPGKEGLCHISELSEGRVTDIHSAIKEGEPIAVKVLDINERGQLKLSRRAATKEMESVQA